jgi:hypothetical protein
MDPFLSWWEWNTEILGSLQIDNSEGSAVCREILEYIVTHIPIARQHPQYAHATIEQMLHDVFSMWVRAMPIAKQRLSKHVPTNMQQ